MNNDNRLHIPSLLSASALLFSGLSTYASSQTVQNVLAAQIRTQGFTCDKPLRAMRDAKHSRPDYDVWILKCSNASYSVGRYPDMAAKVQPLR